MRVEIDSHSGFCFGVVRAISRAEEALQEQGEVFSLGDIVHNRVEVQRLERLGMHTVTHDQMPELGGRSLFIRAHGEPPSTYRLAGRAGHRADRRDLPGRGQTPTARRRSTRKDAAGRRAGRDTRQAGTCRSDRTHRAGRSSHAGRRNRGRPRPDRLHTSDLFPFADHAKHLPVPAPVRPDAQPGHRPCAGLRPRHDLPPGIQSRKSPRGVRRAIRRNYLRLRPQVEQRQGPFRSVSPGQSPQL